MSVRLLDLFRAMPDTSCYASKLCDFALSLVEQWDWVSSEIQVLEDSAEPQQLLLHTDTSYSSAPQISLVSYTKLLGGGRHLLTEYLEKWSLRFHLRLCAPCKRNANRVPFQHQVVFRNYKKPVVHRRQTRRNWCGADLKLWPKSI